MASFSSNVLIKTFSPEPVVAQSSTGSLAGSYNSQANQPDQTGRANQAGADSGSQSGSYDQEELYEGNDQNGGGQ